MCRKFYLTGGGNLLIKRSRREGNPLPRAGRVPPGSFLVMFEKNPPMDGWGMIASGERGHDAFFIVRSEADIKLNMGLINS